MSLCALVPMYFASSACLRDLIRLCFCARRYFDHKRREQLERERGGGGLGGEEGEDLTTEPAAARYAGGGYNLGAQ